MSNQPIESRTSNALGVPIFQWIIKQLDIRSKQLSVEDQSSETINDNVLFRGNRSAWIRMVSSVDLTKSIVTFDNEGVIRSSKSELNKTFSYFQVLCKDIKNKSDLAKKFVLQGGVSTYLNENNKFSYNLREGFINAYNVAGDQEVKNYGYRPMPGITSVKVQTQGKLGSIRAAEIQLKVWDKAQLDIIDALYFKLGYTMFLEWGHTNYYSNDKKFDSTERYSLDPFQAGLTKEDIYSQIATNIKKSDGNYDAMLGMVTNFNFTYNQEGGYDCTIRLISLGVLISSTKMNNPRVLPELQESVIKKFVNRLIELEKEKLAKEKLAASQEKYGINAEKLSHYPSCVRQRGEIRNVIGIEGKPEPFEKEGLFITVNKVNYYFYPLEKYQTSGLSDQGTYKCDGMDILIDGKSEIINKFTYKQLVESKNTTINYPYTRYSNIKQLSVITIDNLLDKLIGQRNLNDDYAYFIKFSSTDYLAFNRFKTVIPLDIKDNIVEAKVIFPSFKTVTITDDKKIPFLKYSATTTDNNVVDLLSFNNFDDSSKSQINYYNDPVTIPILNDAAMLFQFNNKFKNTTRYATLKEKSTLKRYNQASSDKDKLYYVASIAYDSLNLESKYLISISHRGEFNGSYYEIPKKQRIDEVTNVLNNFNTIYKITYVLSRFKSPNSTGSDFEILAKQEMPTPRLLIRLETSTEINVNTTEETKETIKDVLTNVEIVQTATKSKNEKVKLIIVIHTTDHGIISYLEVKKNQGFNISDSKTVANEQKAQNIGETTEEPVSPINAAEIQKTEIEKYKSAFEVIIRSIQLYSLDTSLETINTKVKKLSFLEKEHINFIKDLFSTGLFKDIFNKNEKNELVIKDNKKIKEYCKEYDIMAKKGKFSNNDIGLLVKSIFGFHFGLLGNVVTASELYSKNLMVDFSTLMSSYTIPYEFNQGVVEGTQLNHPVYIPLGLVIMVLNSMCTIYDEEAPLIYLDFNNKSNICLSNAKHLSTNPYDVLIPFQGNNEDFQRILDPSILKNAALENKSNIIVIKNTSGSLDYTPIYTPTNPNEGPQVIKDRISADLLEFKPSEENEVYRGRTMNILISCDYLLRLVGSFEKSNGSGDVYVKEFIEQIMFDINRSLGDINIFRLAYDDGANAFHIIDDQFSPNLENQYPNPNETIKDIENKSRLPLFGKGSIAKTLEIRTEVSSKLANMIAISANADVEDQSNLSKTSDSYGVYNSDYRDRYLPYRRDSIATLTLPTDTMIRAGIQFNEAIKTFYGDATANPGVVSAATSYYIQRMSKIKASEKGTRAAAMIPVSLNFSMDGMSGFGMGQSFTIDPEFLPYTYNLSLTNPYGEQDNVRTVAFVMVGLDQTIENNQWTSNVRTNMIYAKNQDDFKADKIKKLEASSGLISTKPIDATSEFNGISIATKKLNYTAEQIKNAVIKKGYYFYETDLKLNIVGIRNSSTKNLVTNKFDDIITVTYKEGSEIKFYQFAITTDPGAYYVKNFFPSTVATGRMVPGQYINAYSIGVHRSIYEALVEVGSIKAFRDNNKDDIYDETNIQQGNFSMNIHKASNSGIQIATEIDNTSAGCQVFSSTQDFNNFMTIVKSSKTKLNLNSFTYTLLLSDDII